MNNSTLCLLLGSWLLIGLGCSGAPELPKLAEINAIHVSLNDPAKPSYWDYEGEIPQQHWPKLLSHLSSVPYADQPLKWQGLAVITFQTEDGREISVEVYLTNDQSGCYKAGNYYSVPNEAQFARDLKTFLQPQ